MGRSTRNVLEPYNTETKKRNNVHLIPWATAKSLFDLGLTDWALFVLNSGVQQAAYFSNEAVVGMSDAYNDIGIMLYNRQEKEAVAKIFTLTTQIHPSFLAYFNWQ